MDPQMEQMLHMIAQPIFFVKNGIVQWNNEAANYLVFRGQLIDTLSEDISDLYDLWDRQGPMEMTLSVFGIQYLAKVRIVDGGDLFVLERRGEDSYEKGGALLQISIQLRQILQELITAGTAIEDRIAEQEELIPDAEILNRSVYRLLRLSNQLSDGGALLRNAVGASFERVNIRSFMDRFVEETDALLRESGWDMEYEPCDRELWGDVAPELIQRALYQLISHGIRHCASGNGIRIKVWSNLSQICFAMCYKPAAFGMDHLLSGEFGSRSTDMSRWEGLGIDVVRLIAELHGGTTVASSDDNGESRIIFSIRKYRNYRVLRSPKPDTEEMPGFHSGLVELSEILDPKLYHPDRV